MLNVDKHIRKDHSPEQEKQIRDFASTLPTLTEGEFLKEAEQFIWLSAYANNNPRSAYHAMADLCYDEAVNRGDPKLYDRAWKAAASQN